MVSVNAGFGLTGCGNRGLLKNKKMTVKFVFNHEQIMSTVFSDQHYTRINGIQ
jgi:hypothetical protein